MQVNLYQREPGVWRIRTITKDNSGRRKVSNETFRGNRKAAEKRRDEIKNELEHKAKGNEHPYVRKFAANNLTPHPIGLTDRQLDALLDAAHNIEEPWRARFLALVADEILPLDTITQQQVELACVRVRSRMQARGRKGSNADDQQMALRRA